MNNFSHLTNIIWPDPYAVTVYDIKGNRILRNAARRIIVGLIFSCMIIAPVLAAISEDITIPKSRDSLARDDPALLASLKTHIAYNGQVQDARMWGIISYIDTLSNGEGSGDLRNIRDNYLITASSIPLMQTADDIGEAQTELQRQSKFFSETAKEQLVFFHGNLTVMRSEAAAAEASLERSIKNMNESLWLADDSARLSVFNRESRERTALIKSLNIQGVDVSVAKNLSRQIDAQRPELRKILTNQSLPALEVMNAGIKTQNCEFRKILDEYRSHLTIEMKRAAILAMG